MLLPLSHLELALYLYGAALTQLILHLHQSQLNSISYLIQSSKLPTTLVALIAAGLAIVTRGGNVGVWLPLLLQGCRAAAAVCSVEPGLTRQGGLQGSGLQGSVVEAVASAFALVFSACRFKQTCPTLSLAPPSDHM